MVLYCIVSYCFVWYCNASYRVALYWAVLQCNVLCCIVACCVVLCCVLMYYIVLWCSAANMSWNYASQLTLVFSFPKGSSYSSALAITSRCYLCSRTSLAEQEKSSHHDRTLSTYEMQPRKLVSKQELRLVCRNIHWGISISTEKLQVSVAIIVV